MTRRLRNFVFTCNNYTENDIEILKSLDIIKYLCFGKEIGKQGTPHLQGYCELNKQYSFNTVKKKLGDKYHIEVRRGTQKQAIDYCKKDGDFFEMGELNKPGERNDLNELKGMVKDNTPLIEIIGTCNNFQQIRTVEKLFEYKPLSTEYKKKEVYWFWGPTGSGKTQTAYDFIKERDQDFWLSTTKGSEWFNGYWGQKIALLDEVRPSKWPYAEMLRLLDGYEMRVPYKGGFTIWNPELVIITSPTSPSQCYYGQMEYNDGAIDQLLRRITEIREFTNNVPIVPTMFDVPDPLNILNWPDSPETQFNKEMSEYL